MGSSELFDVIDRSLLQDCFGADGLGQELKHAHKTMLGKGQAGVNSRYQNMNAQEDAEQSPLTFAQR